MSHHVELREVVAGGPAQAAYSLSSQCYKRFARHASELGPLKVKAADKTGTEAEREFACAGCWEGLLMLVRQPYQRGYLDLPPILERCCDKGQAMVAEYASAVGALSELLKAARLG